MIRPAGKRHLPVVGDSEPQSNIPGSPWLWVPLGSVVIVSVWAPLLLVALHLGNTRLGMFAPTAVLVLLTFASACSIGGAVVGRFAARPSRWSAGLAGALGALIVLALAALGHALETPLLGATIALCLVSIAVPLAMLGSRWDRRNRA